MPVMSPRVLTAIAALTLALSAGNARAAVLTFTVYSGAPNGVNSSDIANIANTPGSAHIDAQFTYNTGSNLSLNFNDLASQNTQPTGDLASTFFATGTGTISNFTSPDGRFSTGTTGLGQFLASNLSVAGNSNVTFFAITGSFNFGAGSLISLTHDDGASFYTTDSQGHVLTTPYTSPQETTAITGQFTVSGQQNFLIDYVAGNGSPSVLDMVVTPVPEASTWAMMILGFFGLGFMAYRKGTLRLV